MASHPLGLSAKAWRAGATVWLAVALAATLAICFTPSAALAQSPPGFPALTGRVVDEANLLTPETEAEISEKLAALEAETGDQVVVVTLSSLQDREIEDYGYQLGRAWGIGQKDNDSGALLIIAPNERKVRIEVGYGLEPVLTDAMSNHIIQTDILPAFKVGGFARGISTAVDSMIVQLRLDPEEAAARAARIEPEPVEFPYGSMIVVGLMFLFVLIGLMRSASSGGRRRRGDLGSVLIWAAADALKNSGSYGGGSNSGGGFSGGGGSFGGGGASGGW